MVKLLELPQQLNSIVTLSLAVFFFLRIRSLILKYLLDCMAVERFLVFMCNVRLYFRYKKLLIRARTLFEYLFYGQKTELARSSFSYVLKNIFLMLL